MLLFVLGATLVEVAGQQVRTARVAERADLGQQLRHGHARLLSAPLSEVITVGIHQCRAVSGHALHARGFAGAGVAFDSVQRQVQPPGAFQQPVTLLEQAMYLMPAFGRGAGQRSVLDAGGSGPAG